jgi:hypothetical protein
MASLTWRKVSKWNATSKSAEPAHKLSVNVKLCGTACAIRPTIAGRPSTYGIEFRQLLVQKGWHGRAGVDHGGSSPPWQLLSLSFL